MREHATGLLLIAPPEDGSQLPDVHVGSAQQRPIIQVEVVDPGEFAEPFGRVALWIDGYQHAAYLRA